MREIIFRGKRHKDYGEGWVYGVPYFDYANDCIMKDGTGEKVIYPDTVGQYTGLTDKNGKKIFEGDLVRVEVAKIGFVAVCKFYSGSFGLVWHYMGAERYSAFTGMCHVEYEVIGNIHDNPELMEGERHG